VEALLSLARAGETEKARERLKAIVSPPKNRELRIENLELRIENRESRIEA